MKTNQISVWQFKVPTLNFMSKKTWELIEVIPSGRSGPLTVQLIDEQLKQAKEHHIQLTDLLKKLPCHTQAVGRCVKMVTAVSASVCDEMKGDGMVHVRLQSRKNKPIFNTKAHYNTN